VVRAVIDKYARGDACDAKRRVAVHEPLKETCQSTDLGSLCRALGSAVDLTNPDAGRSRHRALAAQTIPCRTNLTETEAQNMIATVAVIHHHLKTPLPKAIEVRYRDGKSGKGGGQFQGVRLAQSQCP